MRVQETGTQCMCGSTSNIELKCLSMLHVACGQTVNEAEHKLNDSHEM